LVDFLKFSDVFLKKISKKMAKPINETPVLEGKDAKEFAEKKKKADTTRASASEKARIRENFAKVVAIANF
jgi:hypothetical protein